MYLVVYFLTGGRRCSDSIEGVHGVRNQPSHHMVTLLFTLLISGMSSRKAVSGRSINADVGRRATVFTAGLGCILNNS